MRFRGAVLGDVFTQNRDELALALGTPEEDEMLRILANPQMQGMFHTNGYSRARRNVLTLFEAAIGKTVQGVSLAEGDRFVTVHLENKWKIQCQLFKPHPNVFLVNGKDIILQAFKLNRDWEGKPAPVSRPAEQVANLATFETRWHKANASKNYVQQLRRTVPFLNEYLAEEVLFRAQNTMDLSELFALSQSILQEIQSPKPCIYFRNGRAELFSLIPLQHRAIRPDEQIEHFDSVEVAVRVYIRKRLSQADFDALYTPLEKALTQSVMHYTRQTEQMLNELSKASRADQYEKWGHLLMASGAHLSKGLKEVTLDDMFEAGHVQKIILDEKLTAIENAQRYYAKARKTRQAREVAEARWTEIEVLATEGQGLLTELKTLKTASEVEKFRARHQELLPKLVSNQAVGMENRPFRRFEVQGYEVWVGRNAKENSELTFKHARKYDYWFHARGVGGSHVVLRWKNDPKAKPNPQLLEKVAEIAAHFSQAKTSSLVPVQLTERKFVRKVKNGAPGQVIIEREQVILVKPKLP